MRGEDIVVFEHERDQVTVGDLREWHYLEVTCPSCGRVGQVYLSKLKRLPATRRIADLAPSFRCSRCWCMGTRFWKVLKIARDD
ncbi:MAG: hypothetical protein AAF950_17185 [Pseudomonadota bacterium]